MRTTVWWFDDVADFIAGYEAFETVVLQDEHAWNLEFLCNLAQLLFNAVIRGGWFRERVDRDARVGRLKARLAELASDLVRPNNALQARASLLTCNRGGSGGSRRGRLFQAFPLGRRGNTPFGVAVRPVWRAAHAGQVRAALPWSGIAGFFPSRCA